MHRGSLLPQAAQIDDFATDNKKEIAFCEEGGGEEEDEEE